MTLAIRVSVREVRSSGYSCMRLNREGDMMAGQRKRRNREALISCWLMSCFPRAWHCSFQEENTSFSSRGKTLRERDHRIQDSLLKAQNPALIFHLKSGFTYIRHVRPKFDKLFTFYFAPLLNRIQNRIHSWSLLCLYLTAQVNLVKMVFPNFLQ